MQPTDIIVYADESGTHDVTGSLRGSQTATLCGFAASPAEWGFFNRDWKSLLDQFQVSEFHFYEWASASAVARKKRASDTTYAKGPYVGWDLPKLDTFRREAARLAGAGHKIGCRGLFYTGRFAEGKKLHQNDPLVYLFGNDPYKILIHEFIDSLQREIAIQWRDVENIDFVFDDTDDDKWKTSFCQAIAARQKQDGRFRDVRFADSKTTYPLQIADMAAFRLRQFLESQLMGKFPDDFTEEDRLLFGNLKKSLAIQNPDKAHLIDP